MSVFTCGRFNHFAETLFIDSHSFSLHSIFKNRYIYRAGPGEDAADRGVFSMAAARIGFVYVESGAFTTYDYVMAVVEAVLYFDADLLQSLPIFTIKK